MLQLRASSLADTHAIAAAVASLARAGDTILLAGGMGAGKTAFAQGFGRALGVDEPITSPTFTLVHSYDLPATQRRARTLHHADLYRLDRTSEVAELALSELAEFGGIVLIEWGDVVEGAFGDHLTVLLEPELVEGDDGDDGGDDGDDGDDDDSRVIADGHRRIALAGVGQSWAARWDRLEWSLEAFQ
ncbi:MAG: tRNA (adenosine(37)-N6)-threonylcarbamoyltransferase complex ATPase subunit type 1 TsaE [Ilumatobacter sp.]|nr:tRNA (adenosine(37)-N6)-threonylcarbamoyltransferase complex ATPase subunit type 1 TsaE [Ilumatobacter sp.]